jgi:inosine-uridine nucleoside N-ribohydrolase
MKKLLPLVLIILFSSRTMAFPVIYDTDMAIDDWFALLYLAKAKDSQLKAVTISCSGESHCQPGEKNAISLLDLVTTQDKIPVAAGDAYPLDGFFVFPSAWQKDSDTLSGVPIAAPSYPATELHAIEVIHHTILNSDEPVTIVAVGPLTNIAQWLMAYPDDVTKVSRLVIMGGALDTKGNIIVPNFTDNHPNKKAEWNLFVDPLSAQIVFNSDLAIELVGLDVTNHVNVTHEYVAEFSKIAHTPEAKFAAEVYKKNDWFIDSGEYYFWDVLAALTSTNPELCQAEQTPLSIGVEKVTDPKHLATSDLTMPKQRWDGQPRSHLNAETAGVISRSKTGKAIAVCLKTDAKKALAIFNATLTAED